MIPNFLSFLFSVSKKTAEYAKLLLSGGAMTVHWQAKEPGMELEEAPHTPL
jgi:hypothetical protein